MKKNNNQENEDTQEQGEGIREPTRKNNLCVIPFVKGTSEKLGRICRKHGLLPVYTQKSTLRRTLTKVKTKQKNRDKGVVYRIPCEEYSKVYIGETGRPLKMRIAEHVRAVKNGDMKNANTVHEDWTSLGTMI